MDDYCNLKNKFRDIPWKDNGTKELTLEALDVFYKIFLSGSLNYYQANSVRSLLIALLSCGDSNAIRKFYENFEIESTTNHKTLTPEEAAAMLC